MRYYVVDVFTDELFRGNPAGVLILDEALDEGTMQSIAAENNLSETAFVVKKSGGDYGLRWFTPETEIDLCGHATLASAYILAEHVKTGQSSMDFHTMSGRLTVERKGGLYVMDFPSRPAAEVPVDPHIAPSIGFRPNKAYKSRDLLVPLESEEQVRSIRPDFEEMLKIKGCFGLIVTAPGDSVDFVSRYFAPGAGIPEDPATGSSHCTLIPFWHERLKKDVMTAFQCSSRGGEFSCEYCGDRVKIGGHAVLYMQGEIRL